MNNLKEQFPTLTDDILTEMQWLYNNSEDINEISGLKQQKFLLFYNLFLLAKKKEANFTSLKAWTNGPVYTQVHSAIKYHYTYKELFQYIEEDYSIDDVLAHITKFIVELLSDEEISNLTHDFDFWKNAIGKEDSKIEIKDISINDLKKINNIINNCDLEFIMNHKVISSPQAKIIVKKEDYQFIKDNFKEGIDNLITEKPIKIELSEGLIKKKQEYDLYHKLIQEA